MFQYPSYEETLDKIESLLLFKIPKNERPPDVRQVHNVKAMEDYVKRADLDLSALTYIHVAGTKGKGSTCTFCESILRESGFKTGLFTSPHLIDVRERIKVNGKPISKELFVKSFWDCFNKLDSTRHDMFPSMATYFRILTLMSFHVFLKEGVDVAIMEVGLGGRLDATNVITPVVSGITKIGYDHCGILGHTLPEIAGEKAGIIKGPNVPVVTFQQRSDEVVKVFQSKADEMKSPLFMCDSLSAFETKSSHRLKMLMLGEHQRKNAALAATLCHIWIKRRQKEQFLEKKVTKFDQVHKFPAFKMEEGMIKGISKCRLEGRGHIVDFRLLDESDKRMPCFYLDGAHTNESIGLCVKWFSDHLEKHPNLDEQKLHSWIMRFNNENGNGNNVSEEVKEFVEKVCKKYELDECDEGKKKKDGKKKRKRVVTVVFNYTGERNLEKLLSPVLDFEGSVVDNIAFVPLESSKDQLRRPKKRNKDQKKKKKKKNEYMKDEYDVVEEEKILKQKKQEKIKQMREWWSGKMLEQKEKEKMNSKIKCLSFDSILESLEWFFLEGEKDEDVEHHVLVTGSLYLVGDFLLKLSEVYATTSRKTNVVH